MSAAHSNCSENSDGRSAGGGKGFMLFGVRVMMEEGSFRKSASMNNLAQYDQQPQDSGNDVAAGYASDDVVHPSGRNRERKRGVPWSEEEHRLFLLGLHRVGKGDWRGISRNYVKTRTPTQVASHAQKYFLRRNNHSRRRRRSSLFDITTDTVTSASEDQMHQENAPQPPIIPRQNLSKNPEKFPVSNFPAAVTPLSIPIPIPSESPMEDLTLGQVNQLNNSPRPIRPIPILPIPPSSKMANLNLSKTTNLEPPSLSLNLSVSSQTPPPPSEEQPSSNEQSPRAQHPPPFKAMPASFNGSGGDSSIISVA
ncbi:transcription factor MYB1R1-like [Andrographis paniculata]|uniref:transcription factor MYB1R1-like n=1 Tax=Andrographis paniculata TaxID=175694 RepID=UPI0021E8B24D|nr:transcription factor MYB1R1-like [Andrographis paniculata]